MQKPPKSVHAQTSGEITDNVILNGFHPSFLFFIICLAAIITLR